MNFPPDCGHHIQVKDSVKTIYDIHRLIEMSNAIKNKNDFVQHFSFDIPIKRN
jgi:hypothetical protein